MPSTPTCVQSRYTARSKVEKEKGLNECERCDREDVKRLFDVSCPLRRSHPLRPGDWIFFFLAANKYSHVHQQRAHGVWLTWAAHFNFNYAAHQWEMVEETRRAGGEWLPSHSQRFDYPTLKHTRLSVQISLPTLPLDASMCITMTHKQHYCHLKWKCYYSHSDTWPHTWLWRHRNVQHHSPFWAARARLHLDKCGYYSSIQHRHHYTTC